MPHQCLQCGHAFEEGSSALLAGCPECKGTRFFYSAQTVDEGERRRIAEQAQKDLRQVVTDLLKDAAPETAKELDGEGWASLRAKDLRRLVKQAQAEAKKAQDDAPPAADPATPPAPAVAEAWQRLAEEAAEARPDTVSIGESGEYDIDVKGLLERNPLVVHKDGSYLIHLPSLFGKD